MKKTPDYANWIPRKMLLCLGGTASAALFLFILSFYGDSGVVLIVIRWIFAVLALALLVIFACMWHARQQLSYEGGGVQGKVLDNVLAHLDWNGKGRLLDIGCGSGAMAIKVARLFPEAEVVGMDYWGPGWDYAKLQCEENARLEGVADRTTFTRGDATRLDFADASFDAVVSNLVFHEVRSQPDKLALIREALRVLKPDGVFVFEDIFFSRSVYGDIDKILRELSGDVFSLTFVNTGKSDFLPRCLKMPLLLGNMGLIKGRK